MAGKRISAELIGILAVGATLAGLMLNGLSGVDERLDALSGHMDARMDALEVRLGSLEQRVARIEGLIEGAGLFRAPEAPSGD